MNPTPLARRLRTLALWGAALGACCVAAAALGQSTAELSRMRNRLVDTEIVAAGVTDPRVVAALRAVPRHEFVPLVERKRAYLDMALPLGHGQTISPPYVVAYMTEQLRVGPSDRVLEVGTGSGYQAAVLGELAREVYSVEIVGPLGRRAERTLKRLGYDNVHVRVGDGYQGWPEAAPFDRVIVTCSPEDIPAPLVSQLRDGGSMVIPVGERYLQNLVRVTKRGGELVREPLRATFFVPMTGAAESLRVVQPDPARPALVNGGFEELLPPPAEGRDAQAEGRQAPTPPSPRGWHYLRQAVLEEHPPGAGGGAYALRFSNKEPGRASQALQGFAVDGRRAPAIRLSARVRGDAIRPGATPRQLPCVVVTYYDERRSALADELLGPFHGTFDWYARTAVLPVPAAAREAIVRVGLLGATGDLWVDDLRVEPVGR